MFSPLRGTAPHWLHQGPSRTYSLSCYYWPIEIARRRWVESDALSRFPASRRTSYPELMVSSDFSCKRFITLVSKILSSIRRSCDHLHTDLDLPFRACPRYQRQYARRCRLCSDILNRIRAYQSRRWNYDCYLMGCVFSVVSVCLFYNVRESRSLCDLRMESGVIGSNYMG